MLNLICGPTGSGKTATLMESIRQDVLAERQSLLLVPEQQAYISERDLTAFLPENAGLFFQVTTFSGLAQSLFRVYGGISRPAADKGAEAVLMWDTLRRLAPHLSQYGKSARNDPTLTNEMLSAVDEFRHNGIVAEQLESAANALPPETPLASKLRDLAMVDADFRLSCSERFGENVSDRLVKLSHLLSSHPSHFAGWHIYLDSFTSFTYPEYSVLSALLSQADGVTVTLTVDTPFSTLPHFKSLSNTAKRLIECANKAGVRVTQRCLTADPSLRPAALSLLERELWRFSSANGEENGLSKEEKAVVEAISCDNLYEEAEACALHILELVQNGMRYGDIVAVVRDTETYRGVLDAAFERYGIPYFYSERTELASKPLSRLILSALRAVSGGYRAQDILTLVKTGLSGADMRDVALFEEYCETWHINGKRFTDEAWSMNPDGLTDRKSDRGNEILDAANRVRKIVMTPLLALHASLRASHRVADRCAAVYDYLSLLDVRHQLSLLAKEELSLGQRKEAGETIRLYDFLVESLTTLTCLLPDTDLTVEEFLSILTLYFSNTDLGSVPTLHDCVTIGSAATLRVENVKASFLLGLCEEEFPRAISDEGLLSEADKDSLSSLGDLAISFDSTKEIRFSEELFYVYRGMTKPTSRLYLSYPVKNPDGSQRSPSLGFTRACLLLGIKPQAFALPFRLRKTGSSDASVQHAEPEIPGTTLHLSQSKVKQFALCPYSYYAAYQLRLREKKDSRVSASDEGTFLHFVFEHFLRACLDEERGLLLPEPQEIEPLADRIVEDYLGRVCPIPPSEMDLRLLHLFERLRDLALLMLRHILDEIQASAFRPTYFEQYIGGTKETDLPAVRIPLQNGNEAVLTGLVDRVDLYENGDEIYVRVVDYKTGKHDFSFRQVMDGTDIQLILYLFAVVASDPERLRFGGANFLYSHMEDGKTEIGRQGVFNEDVAALGALGGVDAKPFMKGLVSASSEELENLAKEMLKTVETIAERILDGEASRTPSKDACRFCLVRDHCAVAYHGKDA